MVQAIEETTPITISTKKREATPFLKYAAIAVIALTLGGIGGSRYYINQIETHNQIAQQEADQQLESQIQQATFDLNTLPSITLNVTKQSGKYHIVAGAFRIEANSDKKVKQLKSKGYSAYKIGVNKYGLHEVVYASYEDRIEALEALRSIKREDNAAAWLKVQELD